MNAPTEQPKDYSEARERIPRKDRPRAMENAIAANPDAFSMHHSDRGSPVLEADITDPTDRRTNLSDFRVDHTTTLDLSSEEIDNLRPDFIIEGFLRQGELLLLGAESKSRKSWLAQDAGFAVASGVPWLPFDDGSGGFATRRTKVHALDLELNRSEILYRFAKARYHRFAGDPGGSRAVSSLFESYSLDGLRSQEFEVVLTQLKPRVTAGDLVIVDCLYRLAPDANEAKEIADNLEMLKRFASETNCGIILVDHFRKAGDDRARNRFAGTFVKQASASTLVAIEVKDDILTLNVDARTFHGQPRVFAAFDTSTYTFKGVTDEAAGAAAAAGKVETYEGYIDLLWRSRLISAGITAQEAGDEWGISRQAASTRLAKLEDLGFVQRPEKSARAKAHRWFLTPQATLKQDSRCNTPKK